VGWGYQKFVRRANDWAIVGVAATGGQIALVNMGQVLVRARAAEGTEPGEDIHADRAYRQHLARVLTRRAPEHQAG
jgi:aerobic carbon-monoxide dehydrogenase medium subunit